MDYGETCLHYKAIERKIKKKKAGSVGNLTRKTIF